MQYLTNYYKNLSEQLQERINILEKYLAEVKVTKVVDGVTVKWDPSKESEEEATERAIKTDPRASALAKDPFDRSEWDKEVDKIENDMLRKRRDLTLNSMRVAANTVEYDRNAPGESLNRNSISLQAERRREAEERDERELRDSPYYKPKQQPKPGEPGYQGPSAGRKQ
jgi:hypothetical protein